MSLPKLQLITSPIITVKVQRGAISHRFHQQQTTQIGRERIGTIPDEASRLPLELKENVLLEEILFSFKLLA